MNSPSLTSAWKKHARGLEHLKALDAQIAGFLHGEQNGITLRPDFDSKTGDHLLRVYTLPTLPDDHDWGVLVGDAIHNFRGALDHMVCALAELVGSKCDTTQFPLGIAGNSSGLGGLHPDHRAFLLSRQPQNEMQVPEHPYTWLKDLSDKDKHRTLVPLFFVGEGFGAPRPPVIGGVLDKWEVNDREPLDIDTEVVRWHTIPDTPGTEPKVGVGVYFFPLVGCMDRRGIIDVLERISETVAGMLRAVQPAFG